ncbi:hypothetical protein JJB11_16375 [Ramlibacter ginsenosidimutans]|uniref:DUF3761 domain-containing protein n=1 Tax=Ramlibacter ginsenosidimutans TaxID=502333 RepID=A0A934TU94_9BURK|nr:hypothetical protein [Ramlibacter ginsenosidimutans]MBK6007677.1 hypothetical protein [Ramlibacter ginsenosidimutans]
MHAVPLLFASLLLAATAHARAQPADPLKSPACGAALAQLQAARDKHAAPAHVEALRSAAATTCLGQPDPPARPARSVQAPVAVPPPRIAPPSQPVPIAAPTPPPPPVAIDRPASPAVCDGGGCWVDDGTHLRRVPPDLRGPGGLCSNLGGQLYCP